ncbi:MAG: aspartate/glutamate racemase family protein, partial [Candidatus Rokuibacteriota bacterium]
MRLLMVNPNTSTESTDAFARLARRAAAPGTEIVAVTGAFGARLMRSPAETTIGAHAALAAIAEHVDGCDAVIIAAFGDYGVTPARDLFPVPVMGIADAAFTVLDLVSRRFAILTVGRAVVEPIRRQAHTRGLADRLTGVHVAEPIADRAAYAEAAARVAAECLEAERPECLLLVGPPLAAIHEELSRRLPVPALEGVSCAVKLVEALVGLGVR